MFMFGNERFELELNHGSIEGRYRINLDFAALWRLSVHWIALKCNRGPLLSRDWRLSAIWQSENGVHAKSGHMGP